MEKYQIIIDDVYQFEISSKDLEDLDIVEKAQDSYHILRNDSSYNVEICTENFNRKTYKVKVNNKYFNVLINNELDMLIQEMGFEIGSGAQVSQIDAPMPGTVLKINITEGQEVEEDEPLLILEAMKMENVLSSPRNGKIKSIEVKEGEAVNKKQILILFEED